MDLKINPKLVRTILPQSQRIVLPRPYQLEPPTVREFLQGLFGREFGKHFADLTITATNVTIGTGAAITPKLVIGESITAGNVLYRKSGDGRYYKAFNTGTVEEYTPAGIALNGGAAGQSLQIQTGGQINIGATTVLVREYFLSANAGQICPATDVTTGRQMVRLGYADTTNTLILDFKILGTAP